MKNRQFSLALNDREMHRIQVQEAQLPQRNSASAAHMEGAKPSSPLPLPPLATPMRTVESETGNKRRPRLRQACHRLLSAL